MTMETKGEKSRKEKMKGNKNAEKWTEKEAVKLLEQALELSYMAKYDFIGEIAQDLKETKDTFDYLINKFPHLTPYKTKIKANCEANCFKNTKKGNINTAAGIINLKSNHGWTDRVQQDVTTQGDKIEAPQIIVSSTELPDKLKGLQNDLGNE